MHYFDSLSELPQGALTDTQRILLLACRTGEVELRTTFCTFAKAEGVVTFGNKGGDQATRKVSPFEGGVEGSDAFTLLAGQIIVCLTNTTVEILSPECDILGVVFSSRAVNNVVLSNPQAWATIHHARLNRIITPSANDWELLRNYINIVRQLHAQPTVHFREELTAALLNSAIQLLIHIAAGDMSPMREEPSLPDRFLSLLHARRGSIRSVNEAAQRLSVSPRHLSQQVLHATGRHASDWIREVICKEIKELMLFSDRSVKEIATTLGFTNLSFFARFFKKHFGMSPSDYRRQPNIQAALTTLQPQQLQALEPQQRQESLLTLQQYLPDTLPNAPMSAAAGLYLRFQHAVNNGRGRVRTVAEVANTMNITPKYLSMLVMKVSGKPALHWIHDATCREIKRLMSDTRIPIGTIAHTLRFSNLSFFTRFFKQHFGVTPTDYRQSLNATTT